MSDTNDIASRVVKRVAELNTNFRAVSLKAGLNQTFVRDLIQRNKSPTAATLNRIAGALEVSAAWLLTGLGDSTALAETAPITGKVGAGPNGEVVFEPVDGELDRVPLPPGGTSGTKGLEVNGTSMHGIANDGWLIFYDDELIVPIDQLYGELCVVWCEDGRTLVKFLQPGRGVGLFDLGSNNAPIIRDVPVRSVAPVTSIVPRLTAKRMLRLQSNFHPIDIPADDF